MCFPYTTIVLAPSIMRYAVYDAFAFQCLHDCVLSFYTLLYSYWGSLLLGVLWGLFSVCSCLALVTFCLSCLSAKVLPGSCHLLHFDKPITALRSGGVQKSILFTVIMHVQLRMKKGAGGCLSNFSPLPQPQVTGQKNGKTKKKLPQTIGKKK